MKILRAYNRDSVIFHTVSLPPDKAQAIKIINLIMTAALILSAAKSAKNINRAAPIIKIYITAFFTLPPPFHIRSSVDFIHRYGQIPPAVIGIYLRVQI